MFYRWLQKRKLRIVRKILSFFLIPSKISFLQKLFKTNDDLIQLSKDLLDVEIQPTVNIKVLYGSVTGKSKLFANEFQKSCQLKGYANCTVINLKDYDPEDKLSQEVTLSYDLYHYDFIFYFLFFKIKPDNVLVIFISTYTDGVPPESAAWFYKYVIEMACDFRYQKDALKGLNYSICGLGNSLYEENFNKVAIELDKAFSGLQANRIAPMYACDENTIKSKHSSLEGDVTYWQNNFFEKLDFYVKNKNSNVNDSAAQSCCQSNEKNPTSGSCCQSQSDKKSNGCCQNGNHDDKDEIDEEEDSAKYEDTTEEEENNENGEEGSFFSDIDDDLVDDENQLVKVKKQQNGLVDMEDLGKVMNGMKNKNKVKNGEPKEMITPLLRKSLEKQGYKLIGSHSGVKLCRWTKSMLRGIF